jgi:ABC-2 type transport system permease protein
MRILDIASKDLTQLMRERNTFLFFLIMPIAFTLLFSFAFGGFSTGISDSRIPVGYLDQDNSRLSRQLHDLLAASEVIRLDEGDTPENMSGRVADEKLAAAIIVPAGYGHNVLRGKPARLTLIADTNTPAGMSAESEVLTASIHLESAVRTAVIMEGLAGDRSPFDYTFELALDAWEDPPITVKDTTSSIITKKNVSAALANTSPGMMLQFAIAGLLVAAQLIVTERKTRCLQRLLTTATARGHILLGHYLAITTIIFSQFILLIGFAQLVLKLDYLSAPVATLLVALSAALCLAALGLLIGTAAKSEEQAIVLSSSRCSFLAVWEEP